MVSATQFGVCNSHSDHGNDLVAALLPKTSRIRTSSRFTLLTCAMIATIFVAITAHALIYRSDAHSQSVEFTSFTHVGSKASAVRGGAFKTSDLSWQRTLSQAIGQPVGNSGEPSSAGASALSGLMKHYAYDQVGELRTSISSLKGQMHHRYDATGRVEETYRLSKGAGTVASSSERFGYDPAGNILDPKVASKMAVDQGSQSRQQRGYVRDNRVRVFEDKRFAYDGHGRLIEKKIAKHTVQRFEWDDEHRLVAVHTTRLGYAAKKAAKGLTAAAAALDQPFGEANTTENKGITQTTRFDYDAIGRRVAKHDQFGTTRFIWEGMRLIEERRGANVITYVYEPNSYVPLARIDASGALTDAGGIADTAPLPMGEGVRRTGEREENTAQAPSLSALSDWVSTTNQSVVDKALKQVSRPYRDAVSADELVAANDDWDALLAPSNLDAKQANGGEPKLANVYYFHTDQVGLPEELSDHSGNIRWRASYKTWGSTVSESWDCVSLNGENVNPLIAQASAYATDAERERANALARKRDEQIKAQALEQNLRFQGQYLDRDTGLHYNTFRFYDPDIGRFISPDPIGLEGGLNFQHYAPNPSTWIDPRGLTTCQMSAANVRAMGPAPAGMKNPHLHHIIREMAPRNWSKAARGAVHHVQNLARKYGIDVNRDPRNFTWAQNGGGAHTQRTAQYIRNQLAAADKAATQAGNPQIFFDKMAQIGRDASNGIFRRP
jgi:RHS repeat-associated protein